LDAATTKHYDEKLRLSGFSGLKEADVYTYVRVRLDPDQSEERSPRYSAEVDVPVERE
jgi:hypothetical protein